MYITCTFSYILIYVYVFIHTMHTQCDDAHQWCLHVHIHTSDTHIAFTNSYK